MGAAIGSVKSMAVSQFALRSQLDRVGIVASIGCAIHCLIAPFVILFAPAIGNGWASPTTHLMIALLVIPVAIFSMVSSYRVHQRSKIVVLGIIGAGLVLLGTASPWLEPLLAKGGSNLGAASPLDGSSTCTDCCPTVEVNETTGAWDWKFPAASWLTMLGGLGLVSAHWANLRCCKGCKDTGSRVGPFCSHG
ncbi:MAG: MerC domain-containing protein [Planctomycetota bacterium]|nr:MAG: MerC domain-containing protein [Planctomycetota bacterium]